MTRTLRNPNTRAAGKCRPRLERLESRLNLSATDPVAPFAAMWSVSAPQTTAAPLGPDLAAVGISPAAGAVVSTPPVTVSVLFDRPIDPSWFGFGDVLIQKEVGGDWVLATDPMSFPGETLGAENELVLTPDAPLGPGHYRLVLPEFSGVMGMDGSIPADTGADVVLGDFTVSRPGVRLSDANDLGTVAGASPVVVAGDLDLGADPSAVLLYKFTLGPGHFWRLGAEVSAQRDGSSLLSALTLFDAQGHPVSLANRGRPDAPNDPYLFAGLAPGTYYLGLSAKLNLPGQPGGYDPVAGTPGSPAGATGGAFHLSIAADAADAPTRLVGATLQWADPTQPTPTGVTLTFSAPLDLATLRGEPCSGLTLIGPGGATYGLTAVGLHEDGLQYYFVFDAPLAPGAYTLRVAEQGGVTDLTGQTPVASDSPAGDLLSFTVPGQPAAAADPHNLGALYPDAVPGVKVQETVLPGQAVTYRFVNLVDGFYRFNTRTGGDPVRLTLVGPGGIVDLGGGTQLVHLRAGVHYLQFANPGATPLSLVWALSRGWDADSLLDNGVGQGPALSLRLVSPGASGFDLAAPSASTPGPGSGVAGSAGPVGPFGGVTGGASAVTLEGLTATPVPSNPAPVVAGYLAPGGLSVTLGNAMVGRPSTSSDHVTVVGPGEGQIGVALASTEDGIPAGLRLDREPAPRRGTPSRGESDPSVALEPAADGESVNGAMAATGDDAVAAARTDAMVAAAADWVTRLGSAALRWLAPEPVDPAPEAAPAELAALPEAPTAESELRDAGRVEQAQFSTPLVVGVVSALAIRYHRPFGRWLRRNSTRPEPRRVPGAPMGRGPRVRV